MPLDIAPPGAMRAEADGHRTADPWARFERAALTAPAAAAVTDGTVTYVYGEVHRRALALAGRLAARGAVPGERVLLCCERGVDAIVGVLAVAAAGAALVPVELDGPSERVRRIVSASAPRIALADAHGADTAKACGVPTIRCDLPSDEGPTPDTARTATARTATPAPPSLPAYVLFTSGSTGLPKGVEVTRANVAALLTGADSWDTSAPGDVWACFHAFTFDIAMWEIWRPLTCGALLYVMPRASLIDGDLAFELAAKHRVNVLCHTPTAARLLVDRVRHRGLPPDLRRLYLAGEQLAFGSLQPLVPAVRSGQLETWNLYGPTEASVYSTGHRITADEIEGERRSLIGRALPHARTDVRGTDADGVGELWIGGDGVAAGYFGDPALTAQCFADEPGGRVYRTGDVVRDIGDGVLEFLGRRGGFTKVRGYRVEPGEVAAALCEHPAVGQAAATVTDAFAWGPTLVAAVVCRPGALVAEVELRRHAAERLPHYMRPGRIVFTEALPLLPSGKLDEAGLRAEVDRRLAVHPHTADPGRRANSPQDSC